MRKKIQELEKELTRKGENKSNTNNQQKNLQVPPRNGGGEPSNQNNNRGMENQQNSNPKGQVNPMELNDILQIINTTMATLKAFESRCRNAESI